MTRREVVEWSSRRGAAERQNGRLLSMALEIRPSPVHGRGVFVTRAYRPGTVLETAPVVVLPPAEVETIAATTLGRYVFDWYGGEGAMCFGWASLCNHASGANAEVVVRDDPPLAQLLTVTWLHAGDEVLIDYGPAAPPKEG